MAALDELFALEVEFHRRLRLQALGRAEAGSIHTSYALQFGYERLLQSLGAVTTRQVDRLAETCTTSEDPRDLLAACNSLKRVLGL